MGSQVVRYLGRDVGSIVGEYLLPDISSMKQLYTSVMDGTCVYRSHIPDIIAQEVYFRLRRRLGPYVKAIYNGINHYQNHVYTLTYQYNVTIDNAIEDLKDVIYTRYLPYINTRYDHPWYYLYLTIPLVDMSYADVVRLKVANAVHLWKIPRLSSSIRPSECQGISSVHH